MSRKGRRKPAFLLFFGYSGSATVGLFIFPSGKKALLSKQLRQDAGGIRRRPGDHGNTRKQMLDLAIVGGGPGGLMSAWYLKKKLGELCRITIFEASDRVGGKILTRKFDSAPAIYEAGVA